MNISPEDAMLALYPPEVEPDWETLDLDSDLWWSFFDFDQWEGHPGPCMEPGCTHKRAYSSYQGKRVCNAHNPIIVRKKAVNFLWRRRMDELKERKLHGYQFPSEFSRSVYDRWRIESDMNIPSRFATHSPMAVALIEQEDANNRSIYRLSMEPQEQTPEFPGGPFWYAVIEPLVKQRRTHPQGSWHDEGIPLEWEIRRELREIVLLAVERIFRHQSEPIWRSSLDKKRGKQRSRAIEITMVKSIQ